MRKAAFFVFVLLSVFFSFQVQAQEATPQEGWMPKWNVGDWWVVEVEYDLAEFDTSGMMNEDIWQIVPVKYSVVSEEDLDGERVYKIEIRPAKETSFSPREYNLWVSKQNLFMRKIESGKIEDGYAYTYVYDKASYGVFDLFGHFNLHAFPIFPLPAEKNTIEHRIMKGRIKYKEKRLINGQWQEEKERKPWMGGQISEPIELASLPQDEKINKDFLQGNFYKVAINGNEVIQYWSKDLPWWVYYDEGSIKGYLREYHISAGK